MEIIQRIEFPSAHQNKVGHHIFSTNHLVDEGKANDVISTLGVFFCDSLDLCYDPCHVIKHEL